MWVASLYLARMYVSHYKRTQDVNCKCREVELKPDTFQELVSEAGDVASVCLGILSKLASGSCKIKNELS